MQDFHQKPVPENIQEQVTALGSAMGTVPSGKTLQGQVDTLSSKLTTIKTKSFTPTEASASSVSSYSDTSLKNKIICGFNISGVSTKNISVVSLRSDNNGLALAFRNNDATAFTPAAVDVYYLDI